jgi:hypothetical protein
VRELVFIARGLLQVRKEGIWETDSIGGSKGKKSVTGMEKKKTALTSGTMVSVTRSEERKALRVLARTGLLARAGLGPRGEAGGTARARGSKRATGKDWVAGPKAREGSETLFLFPFQIFQSIFN